MTETLAHTLAAMAFQSLLGALFGLPLISLGVFAAGFIAMLIELDYNPYPEPSGRKSPYAHSLFFAVVWVSLFTLLFLILSRLGKVSLDACLEASLAFVSAFSSHLAIDAVMDDGIYTFPTASLKHWFVPLPKGSDKAWKGWKKVSVKVAGRSWKESDSIPNIVISTISFAIILAAVAMMPL